MRISRLWIVPLVILILLTAQADGRGGAVARYSVTDLGVLAGNEVSEANCINNKGQIVGVSADYWVMIYRNSHAVLFQDGKVKDLGSLPLCKDFSASSINSEGEIIGTGRGVKGLGDPKVKDPYIEKGFLYRGGTILDIGRPEGNKQVSTRQINDLGVVVGSLDVESKAFVYKDGRFTLLPVPKGSRSCQGIAINNKGQIAVTANYEDPASGVHDHAFLYDRGKYTDLGTLGTKQTSAGGIGPDGSVLGEVDMAQTDKNGNHYEHAFVWRRGRGMVDLGSLGGIYCDALSMNRRGEIVGWSQLKVKNFDPRVDIERALLWRGGKMYNLNDLIPKDSEWTLTEARSINDKGQIVGVGSHNGLRRAFLLTPTSNY